MYSIIIERSKECMQVVNILIKHPEPVAVLNCLEQENKWADLDLLYFKTLEELNEFLLSNLKI